MYRKYQSKRFRGNFFHSLAGLIFISLVAVSLSLPNPFRPAILAKTTIHVAADAKGDKAEMDGSDKKPFAKIQDGIDKARDKEANVYVHSGTYHENIEIWEKVEVDGAGKEKVVIKAKDSGQPVVTMHHKTGLSHVSVKEGEDGILVKKESGAYINHCNVENNRHDGIKVREAKIKDSRKLKIYNTYLAFNGWNGIYSEKRLISFNDNLIYKNERDGAEFRKGSEGFMEDNKYKDNDEDGLQLTLDGSKITIKDNVFTKNGSNGLEIRTKGEDGNIWVKKSDFKNNKGWGIKKIEKRPLGVDRFNRAVFVRSDNYFFGNDDGGISPVTPH